MTEHEQELLSSFKDKVGALIELHQQAKGEIVRLRTKNLQLENKIEGLEEEKVELYDKIEKMKLADAFRGMSYSRDEAKKRISSLVREIDHCIALLNK